MKKIGKLFTYLFLIIITFVSIFPFYFMFIAGTNTNKDILSNPPKLSVGSHLVENLGILTERIDILLTTYNTFFVSVVYTILALLLYSSAGYILAKFDFKGKAIIFGFIMISMMIPTQVLYVPWFKMMISVNMTDNHWGVILPLLANSFGVFLMRQNMLSFPTALIEASRIDGCTEARTFISIILPNTKPALGALVIYMFTSMWNNFMWPLIILGSKTRYTFPVALAMLDGNPTNKNYAVILLATTIATLPILVIFLAFQKQFVAGVMGGAVKE